METFKQRWLFSLIFVLLNVSITVSQQTQQEANNKLQSLWQISYDIDNITFTEQDVITINFTLVQQQTPIIPLRGIVHYDKVARVLNCSYDEESIRDLKSAATDGTVKSLTGKCHIEATRLGETYFQVVRNDSTYNNKNKNFTREETVKLIVLRLQGIKELIFRIVTIVLVVWMTFLMGCGLDPFIIKDYLKKPIAPAIGFASQFVFMPCIAFGLAKLTNLENSFGFGLLTIGCSPGGGGSNIWTILLHGELNLSMTMTFISTIFSLGMMPFWIFVFGRFFLDPSKIKIPYGMIAANLLQIVIPCCLGLLLKWKKPDIAAKLTKLIRYFALAFIVWVFSFGVYANFYIFKLMGDYPLLLPIGASLPWLGFVFGFLLALVTKRTLRESITIALETGIQNIGIPILILLYSMPAPQGPLGAAMPIIVAIFTPFPLYIIYIVLLIVRRCKKKTKKEEEVDDKEGEKEPSKEEKAFIKKGKKKEKKKKDYELEAV